MLYPMGDSRHTQNIQINKVIGESEKCVFHFTEKTKWTFWPTEYNITDENKTSPLSSQTSMIFFLPFFR